MSDRVSRCRGMPLRIAQGRWSALMLCLAAWIGAPMVAADERQGWLAAFANGPISSDSRVLGWADLHARFRDDGETMDTVILRPGLGWRVNTGLDLWAGYARIEGRRPGRDLEEERAWQQASYPIAEWAGGRLAGRTRLEQRFRDTGGDTGWRLRQFVRYARAFAGTDFGIVVSTEAFFGLNQADWGQRSGFDQNRGFLGAYFQPRKSLRVEAGYLNQYIRVPARTPDRTLHNFSLTVFVLR